MIRALSPSPSQSGTTTAPKPAPSAELRDAAKQFEAIFLRQMLARARATDFGGGALSGSSGLETFTQMRDDRFADIAAETGSLGIARMLEMQLAQRAGPGR